MEKEIIKKLLENNISPKYFGFTYLLTAIECVVLNDINIAICKGVYSCVAKVHNTTFSRAERCIRHALQKSEMKEVPSEFIRRIANEIKYNI